MRLFYPHHVVLQTLGGLLPSRVSQQGHRATLHVPPSGEVHSAVALKLYGASRLVFFFCSKRDYSSQGINPRTRFVLSAALTTVIRPTDGGGVRPDEDKPYKGGLDTGRRSAVLYPPLRTAQNDSGCQVRGPVLQRERGNSHARKGGRDPESETNDAVEVQLVFCPR